MLKLGPDGRSRLGVLGQLRQVLISIPMDHHERLVPNVMEWELTECDLNKDVRLMWFRYTAEDSGKNKWIGYSVFTQSPWVRDMVYRVEERKHPHKPAIDFINDLLNPIEKFEKLVSELVRKELKQTQ
ncbi:MAG: hypothetical protein WBF33_05990 [Candidatus Nitrosopolaris sp.]